jgi:hypothetical protein
LREYNDPSWDVLQVLRHYPAKIPHFFENLKFLRFVQFLLNTPLITFEPFIKALLTGLQRDARRSRPPIVYGLNGLRPISASLGLPSI